MDGLSKKRQGLGKALISLDEILDEEFSIIVRDATIQRFEYTVEVFWKFVKEYLLAREGIECYSPKSCMRELYSVGNIDEDETQTLLKMIDDRNLTSHTYQESVSEIIYDNIPEYFQLMKQIYEELKNF